MKYTVGDKVRIVSKKNGGFWNLAGKMDKWMGKVMTIRGPEEDCYKMEEDLLDRANGDTQGWCWYPHMTDGLAYTDKLKDCGIAIVQDGAVVTAIMRDKLGVEIKTASARCSDSDTFDFEVGAKLALERLTFTPHVALGKENYGVIGEKADFTAMFGEELFVGDTVETYSTHSNRVPPVEFVCVANKWQIRKVGSYRDLTHGQCVGDLTAILKEEN